MKKFKIIKEKLKIMINYKLLRKVKINRKNKFINLNINQIKTNFNLKILQQWWITHLYNQFLTITKMNCRKTEYYY